MANSKKTCPLCHIPMAAHLIHRHMDRVHHTPCEYCGAMCVSGTSLQNGNNYGTHLRRIHGIEITPRAQGTTTVEQRARTRTMTMEERDAVCAEAREIIDAARGYMPL